MRSRPRVDSKRTPLRGAPISSQARPRPMAYPAKQEVEQPGKRARIPGRAPHLDPEDELQKVDRGAGEEEEQAAIQRPLRAPLPEEAEQGGRLQHGRHRHDGDDHAERHVRHVNALRAWAWRPASASFPNTRSGAIETDTNNNPMSAALAATLAVEEGLIRHWRHDSSKV
jgi:hypothetical protein